MPTDGLAVGIPTYNQAAFIGATIESLLRQSRPPDEIVISDHQSTDDTAKIVEGFAPRVRYVQPPVGTSYGGQWNFTLSQLKSRWITLLSSDDIAYPNYVESILQGAERSPRAVLVRGAWNEIDSHGATLVTRRLLGVKSISPPRRNLLDQKYGPKASFAAWAVSRDAWLRCGGVPEYIESFNDWAFFVRLAPYGDFVYQPEIIAGYRVGHDGDKFDKVKRRLLMFLRDEFRLYNQTFPEAAERLKMRDTRWIARASRRKFLHYLRELDGQRDRFTLEEQIAVCEALNPWAASVGERLRMQRFEAKQKIVYPLRIGDKIKARIRPLYGKLHEQRARGSSQT